MSMCTNDKVCSSDKAREFFDKISSKIKHKEEFDADHDLLAQDLMP